MSKALDLSKLSKFEGGWDDFGSGWGFWGQSVAEYLGLALICVWGSALEGFGLGAGLFFYGVWALSWHFLISWDRKS